MAIYHLDVTPVQRSKGKSSVAAAAYRAGVSLVNERTGLIHNFSRRSGVDFEQIIGFEGSRSELWNLAESCEKRKDATTAREYEIALPRELSQDQNIELAMSYGQWLRREHGCAVDVCIHDLKSKNPHAHILTTTRAATGRDLGAKVAREWSDTRRKKAGLEGRKVELEKARIAWEKIANFALEKYGHDARIDHRSLAAQGVTDRIPQIHVGKAVGEMEGRGVRTNIGDRVRVIKREQRELDNAKAPEPVPDSVVKREPNNAKQKKKPKQKPKKPEVSPTLTSAKADIMRDFGVLMDASKQPNTVMPFERFREIWNKAQIRAEAMIRKWQGLTTQNRPAGPRSRDLER